MYTISLIVKKKQLNINQKNAFYMSNELEQDWDSFSIIKIFENVAMGQAIVV